MSSSSNLPASFKYKVPTTASGFHKVTQNTGNTYFTPKYGNRPHRVSGKLCPLQNGSITFICCAIFVNLTGDLKLQSECISCVNKHLYKAILFIGGIGGQNCCYLELTLRQGSADANASNNGTSFRFIFVGIFVINVTNGHEKCIRGQIGFVQDSI